MMKKVLYAAMAAMLCLSLLSACGGKQKEEKNVDLAAFAQTLTENHEFAAFVQRVDPTDEEFGGIMLDNAYPGLKELDPEQMEIYLSMVSFSTGEFALVRAKSAEDAAKVKNIFQARIDGMTEEGVNYPETVELWTNSSRLADHGTYVMLVCHEDADAIGNEFNALFS